MKLVELRVVATPSSALQLISGAAEDSDDLSGYALFDDTPSTFVEPLLMVIQ